MKSLLAMAKPCLAMLLLLIAAAMPMMAHAAVSDAHNTIYFDANDNIIGQRIIDCHNYSAYAGDVSSSNQFVYAESWNCGANYVICNQSSSTPQCTMIPTGPGYSQYFKSATGRSVAEYCAASTAYTPGVPFSGHPGCDSSSGGYIQTITFLPFTKGNPPL